MKLWDFFAVSLMCAAVSSPAFAADSPLKDWGLGIGIAVEFYSDGYVKTASVNGQEKIVTIDEGYKYSPAFWSTINWTATARCSDIRAPGKWFCTDWVKPGLFAGVRLVGQDGAGLDGFSAGVQWAWMRRDDDQKDQKRPSLNFGFGYVVHNTQRLANGINEGTALPAQFEGVKYKKTTEGSWMFIVTKDIYR